MINILMALMNKQPARTHKKLEHRNGISKKESEKNLHIKSTVSVMRNIFDRLISRLDTAEKKTI